MNILLTGAAGFLGRATYTCLYNAGHRIIPVGHKKSRYEDQISLNMAEITLESLRKQLPITDAIIHLASKVDFSQGFDEDLYRVNTMASIILAQIAKERNTKFIFSSTATIAGTSCLLISKSSIPLPDTPYALSKWIAEKGIHSTVENSASLRFGGIFGLEGPSHLGLNNAIKGALDKKVPEIKGSGKAKRNYIYVKDAARAIQYCLEEDIKGVHLIAGSEVLSIKEMLQSICKEYIPEEEPEFVEGEDTKDQVIEPSPLFPKTRTFVESLHDIKYDYEKNSGH